MPRNKRPQDRAEKREEIVDAARRLFIDDGYDATPMSRLATAAGVTPNTIYWYFEDKDDVLIAVLGAVVADRWSKYQALAERPFDERLLWFVDGLQQMRRLVTTVHARVQFSPAVNEWHEQFHLMAEGLLRHELQGAGAPASVLDAEVKIGVFTIEGMLMHDLTGDERNAVCQSLAARWA